MRPPWEDWDLPSDADMLNWVEHHRATLSANEGGGWCVSWREANGSRTIVSATARAALETAMKATP